MQFNTRRSDDSIHSVLFVDKLFTRRANCLFTLCCKTYVFIGQLTSQLEVPGFESSKCFSVWNLNVVTMQVQRHAFEVNW